MAARRSCSAWSLGALVGAWQGFWVAYVGIPAFIVTLAGMLIFRGLDLMVLDAPVDRRCPRRFQKIANGFLPEMGPNTGLPQPDPDPRRCSASRSSSYSSSANRADAQASTTIDVPPMAWSSSSWSSSRRPAPRHRHAAGVSYKGMPVVGLILVRAGRASTRFITQRTVFGRHIYAVGGNRNAARLSGVNTKRVDFLVMVNMGVLAGVAGLVFTAHLNAANPKAGVGFELDAIAAAFIGGAAVAGGVGTVTGADHRWSGHGCAEQRHVDHGRRQRLAAGHQGPGAARSPSPSTCCRRRPAVAARSCRW